MEHDSGAIDTIKVDHQLGDSRIQEIVLEKHAARPPPPQRSLARSIAIVATCTAAMVVNVRPLVSWHRFAC